MKLRDFYLERCNRFFKCGELGTTSSVLHVKHATVPSAQRVSEPTRSQLRKQTLADLEYRIVTCRLPHPRIQCALQPTAVRAGQNAPQASTEVDTCHFFDFTEHVFFFLQRQGNKKKMTDCPAFLGFCTNPSSECRQETLLEILPWGCSRVAAEPAVEKTSRADVTLAVAEADLRDDPAHTDDEAAPDEFVKVHSSSNTEMPAVFTDALPRIPVSLRDLTEADCLQACRERSACKAFRFDAFDQSDTPDTPSTCLLFQSKEEELDCTQSNCLAELDFKASWTGFHSVAYIRNSLVNA